MTDEVNMNPPFVCGVCQIEFDNDCPVCLKCNKPVCPSCSLGTGTENPPDYCPLCKKETGWRCKTSEDITEATKDSD